MAFRLGNAGSPAIGNLSAGSNVLSQTGPDLQEIETEVGNSIP